MRLLHTLIEERRTQPWILRDNKIAIQHQENADCSGVIAAGAVPETCLGRVQLLLCPVAGLLCILACRCIHPRHALHLLLDRDWAPVLAAGCCNGRALDAPNACQNEAERDPTGHLRLKEEGVGACRLLFSLLHIALVRGSAYMNAWVHQVPGYNGLPTSCLLPLAATQASPCAGAGGNADRSRHLTTFRS